MLESICDKGTGEWNKKAGCLGLVDKTQRRLGWIIAVETVFGTVHLSYEHSLCCQAVSHPVWMITFAVGTHSRQGDAAPIEV